MGLDDASDSGDAARPRRNEEHEVIAAGYQCRGCRATASEVDDTHIEGASRGLKDDSG